MTVPSGFGIDWHVLFRFPDGSTDAVWFREPGQIELVVEALASTRTWAELDVVGLDSERGRPFATADEITALIRESDGGRFALARGGPRNAVFVDEAEASISLDVSFAALDIKTRLRDESLERIGPAALSEMIEVVVALHASWQGRSQLLIARAAPFASGTFVLPRARPPRRADRSVDAITEILASDFDEDSTSAAYLRDATALREAATPPGVRRAERGRLVVMRWVDDPRDAHAVAIAAARHEAWLAQHVPTWLAPGWTDDGDRAVPLGSVGEEPPFRVVDRLSATGYVALPDDADDAPAWEAIARACAAPPPGIDHVAVIAPSRADALRLRERAHAVGASTTVYVSPQQVLLDPDPPGTWLTLR